MADYEDDRKCVLGKLQQASGAMRWLSRWHLEMAADVCGKTCNDLIEFRSEGESHLAMLGTLSASTFQLTAMYGRHIFKSASTFCNAF